MKPLTHAQIAAHTSAVAYEIYTDKIKRARSQKRKDELHAEMVQLLSEIADWEELVQKIGVVSLTQA